ncbi:hypothetical protein CARUB_v10028547mg [Capsella rubella]|uniref:Palmitoyl protein thioesterase family protein n=1 Tax=Capsella rubella TaxID=81985 RepID=R0F0P8_9BRAS|nr:hypothetical protein CARUB_v10028547mg [Capsella rubella]
MEKGLKRSCVTVVVAFLCMVHVSVSVPFIMLHGIAAQCADGTNDNFTHLLTNLSGSPGSCIEIGDGRHDSWFMPLTRQAEIACEKEQGNLVARGLIEFCDGGPPVYNYISLAGPHAGISSVPKCLDRLAPSGYFKDPMDVAKYLESSKYLPKLSNEIPEQRNSTYKERFASLHNLVLVKFQDDTIIVPNDSTWFGFYPDGDFEHVLPAQKTKLYTEDWIGLKTLDVAGKVKFVSVPGEHVKMAKEDVVKYVVPYLQNKPSLTQRLNRKTKEPLHP